MIRLSIVFVAISISLLAQADLARIVGTVSDPTGAVIPGASITAKDNRTGSLRQATADERGYYVIANISPSMYSLTRYQSPSSVLSAQKTSTTWG